MTRWPLPENSSSGERLEGSLVDLLPLCCYSYLYALFIYFIHILSVGTIHSLSKPSVHLFFIGKDINKYGFGHIKLGV